MTYTEAIRTLAIAIGFQRGINDQSFNLSKIEEKCLEIAANYNQDGLISLCNDKYRLLKVVHESFENDFKTN